MAFKNIFLMLLLLSTQVHAESRFTYAHTDLFGGVVALTNHAGNVIARKDYTPYGESSGNDGSNHIGFTGHVEDSLTHLTYMQQRLQDPMTGRFLSIDSKPVDPNDPATFNRYAYANNNPYKFVDPDGREVTISINRQTYTDKSIISTVTVTSDKTQASFSGYALEPVVAGEYGMKMPVPAGEHSASVRTDHDPNRIQLEGVKSYSEIQLHEGNEPRDSDGCFIVGRSKGENKVRASKDAMKDINKVVQQDGSGKIKANITGSNQNPNAGGKKNVK